MIRDDKNLHFFLQNDDTETGHASLCRPVNTFAHLPQPQLTPAPFTLPRNTQRHIPAPGPCGGQDRGPGPCPHAGNPQG